MEKALTIYWFRQDLRVSDNPGLTAALEQGDVLPIYILDEESAGVFAPGGASRWWLHHSLQALDESMQGKLNLYIGEASTIIANLQTRFAISGVYWNRCYEPWRIPRDKSIKQTLLSQGVSVESFNGSLLNEPWMTLKNDGSPYKVFTPYYRKASQMDHYPSPLPPPQSLASLQVDQEACKLHELSLLPTVKWDAEFYNCWKPGELGAHSTLDKFLENGITHYKNGRDFPALDAVSTLSPHLHFGEISPQQISNALLMCPADDNRPHFKKELGWREFSYYLLFHWPELPTHNLKNNLDGFPWGNHPDWLAQWQQGLTGYPLVDAGMRELWQTGFMHNRVRMITASFLVRNVLGEWRRGASWVLDCLVDADLASNSASWQWVAGCGTDSSPYFRIFNPVTQGEKFDANGDYTRRYVPELEHLPKKYLFRPWEAPPEVLEKANVVLGKTYPRPIVDIKISRENALDAYELTKSFRNN
jgi:deoxyribodipyrimidine photo-lyase